MSGPKKSGRSDGLHVVVKHAPRYPAQGNKGALVAVDQRADFHVDDEFDVACPAVAECGAEGVEGSLPLRNSTQSTCICSPGVVSKRTTGSAGSVGLMPRE